MSRLPNSLKRLLGLGMAVMYLGFILSGQAWAMTFEDLQDIVDEHPRFTREEEPTSPCGLNTLPDTPNNKKLFVIGDSLTVGFARYGGLKRANELGLSANETYAVTDTGVEGGENARYTGTSLEADGGFNTDRVKNKLSEHAQDLVDKGIVIIGLGTNDYGRERKLQYRDFIDFVWTNNPEAHIYWVNTKFYHPEVASYEVINADIATVVAEKVAEKPGQITVIDYAAGVAENPAMGPATSGSDQIHPGKTAYEAKTDFVLSKITGATATTDPDATFTAGPSATPSAASPTGCGAQPVGGGDNSAAVWNYLLSKDLTPVQIAGIMGNLQAEAHFEPQLVQYGFTSACGQVSEAGKPSSLCNTHKVDGNTGYGLAQWTSSGRQQNLLDFAQSKGSVDPTTGTIISGVLNIQLDFLWQEISTSYNNSVLVPLRAVTDDVREAAHLVLWNFECPDTCRDYKETNSAADKARYEKTLDDRTAFAQAWLTKYGSL